MEQWADFNRRMTASLAAVTAGYGLTLSPEGLDLALEHARLLVAWNTRTNLTRLTSPEELARRHFGESFLAASLLPAGPIDVLDVGAGAGFPGLAMRIVRPDTRLTLLEPRAPKAAFLSAVAALHPPPVPRVLPRRLEDLDPGLAWDAITLRALRPDFERLVRHLAPSGRLLLFEGPRAGLAHEARKAGFSVTETVPLGGDVGAILSLRLGP